MKTTASLLVLLALCFGTNLHAQAFKAPPGADTSRYQQQALRDQAEALRRQAEQQRQQQAEQRRIQQQTESANRAQQLIRSQQEQQQQLQNSFNKLANDVSESMRNKNRNNSESQPSAVWDENRQEYRSRDGGPPPIITYRKPDGSVDYSGIPVEAIDPSAQPDVRYVTGRGSRENSRSVPLEPYRPQQRLTELFNNSPDTGESIVSGKQASPNASIFSELVQAQGVSVGIDGAGLFSDVTAPPSSTEPPADSSSRLQAVTELARAVFDDAKKVVKETARTLANEVIEQARNGEAGDLRAAAQSGIAGKFQEIKDEAVKALDDRARSLTKGPVEKGVYDIFVSPETRAPTPFHLYKNFDAHNQEMYGKGLDDFLGIPAAK